MKDNAIYRREVWAGSGEPLPSISFARVEPEVEQPFPRPEVTSTDTAGRVEPPTLVIDLAACAQALGWDHMITYARGWVPHARTGRPLAGVRESWAVRLRREGRRAVAVRMGGAWVSMWTWGADDRFTHHQGITAFREAIR